MSNFPDIWWPYIQQAASIPGGTVSGNQSNWTSGVITRVYSGITIRVSGVTSEVVSGNQANFGSGVVAVTYSGNQLRLTSGIICDTISANVFSQTTTTANLFTANSGFQGPVHSGTQATFSGIMSNIISGQQTNLASGLIAQQMSGSMCGFASGLINSLMMVGSGAPVNDRSGYVVNINATGSGAGGLRITSGQLTIANVGGSPGWGSGQTSGFVKLDFPARSTNYFVFITSSLSGFNYTAPQSGYTNSGFLVVGNAAPAFTPDLSFTWLVLRSSTENP